MIIKDLTQEQMNYVKDNAKITIENDGISMWVDFNLPQFHGKNTTMLNFKFYIDHFEIKPIDGLERDDGFEGYPYCWTDRRPREVVFPMRKGDRENEWLSYTPIVKEMTVEEIEKELGYKIKVVGDK